MTRLTTLANSEAVAVRAAQDIALLIAEAIGRRGAAHLALSGGTTPRRAYELLAGEGLAWDAVHVWFADERCVPPDDPESNYLLAQQTLLSGASLPAENVHRMLGELGPEEGASHYAEELSATLEAADGEPPQLDVIVLGIGPDGHVASLFPGAQTLDAGEQAICLGVHNSPKPPPERITLSLAVLRAAQRCVLLATGASKSDAMSAAMATPSRHVPASLLRRERLTAIVDDAAAPAAPLQ
ncbi:MAG TPA: 6-phosphogluconolactonase [Solirubrobacteraceae bacterium]|jgi:6-phosphogluconolactonase